MCETCIEEKGWNNLKNNLPNTHVYKCYYATKCKGKGRAKGGFLIKRKKMGRKGK